MAASVASCAGARSPLAGRWRLTSIDGQAEAPRAGRAAPHVAFTADGQLDGDDGCNRFGGAYRIEGDAIVAPDIVQTLATCLPADPRREARQRVFVGAFDRATFQVRGDILTLRTAAGRRVVLRRETSR